MFNKLGSAIIAGALLLAGSQVASAASPATQSFMDNVMPNVDFLDRSSRLALDTSKSTALREFAHGQAAQQTLAANSLYDWSQSAPAKAADVVVTGRSAALDGQKAPVVDNRLPLGEEDLNSLEGLTGREFDDQFKAKQVAALEQIKTDYQAYIAGGDDPVLLGIAGRELPKVQAQLARLGKL